MNDEIYGLIRKEVVKDFEKLEGLNDDQRKECINEVLKFIDKLQIEEKNDLERVKIEMENKLTVSELIKTVTPGVIGIVNLIFHHNELTKILKFEEVGKIVSKPGKEWHFMK